MSINTLDMQPVYPHVHAGQMNNVARITTVLIIIVCYSSPSLLVIGISKVENVKMMHRRLLRPCLCNWLSLTDIPAQFQGQMNPKVRIPPILTIIVCYSSPSLLVIGISGVENPQILCECLLKSWLLSQTDTTP